METINLSDAKKELGQHWLEDEFILHEIVQSAGIKAGDVVLEIGPGRGSLTQSLVDAGAIVTALEYDADLIKPLQKKFNTSQVKIIQDDIRTFDFRQMDPGYKIVANIPYYLTSYLIRSLSESVNKPSTAALLVQKEVAERICASPGDMSILSVVAQLNFSCRLGLLVPAVYFDPAPKVDSQVVIMEAHTNPLFDIGDMKLFLKIVKAGFSERRKTLRNSLSGGLAQQKVDIELILNKSGIDLGRRAQELSLDEWYTLYKAINNRNM